MKRQLKGDKKPFNCLFLFVQKSSFCILYEKILQFVRKATITIAKNLCLQRMRERKKAECTSQEGWELAIPDTDMLTMEDRSILVTCMEQLSDEERQIVMLHAAVGFKHREIARIMELPLSTVLSKYARALKRLKQYLQ